MHVCGGHGHEKGHTYSSYRFPGINIIKYPAIISRGRHEMSLSQRYQNRGHFYIILGQCTEVMFCSGLSPRYYRVGYVCH